MSYQGRQGLPAEQRGWRNALKPFQNTQYRWLYGSNMAVFFAMQAQGMVVRPWITYQLTDSKLLLGLMMLTMAGPMVAVAPFAGVWADRLERRNLVVAGQSIIVLGEFVILGLLMSGELQFWHLMAVASVMGCVFPFIMPARQALVVNVVGKASLSQAMALSMTGMNATRVVGPALAAGLMSWIGVEWTYASLTIFYVIGVLTLLGVHRQEPPQHMREISVMRSMADGFRYFRTNETVLVLTLFGLVPMLLAMPFMTLLVVFARDIWEVGTTGLGYLQFAGGLGGILGSAWVASLGDNPRRLMLQMLSVVVFCVSLFGFALSPWFVLGIGLVFVANIFQSLFGTLNSTAVQLLIPDEVRGRVSSFMMMSFSLPMLGAFPMSVMAEFWGAPVAVGSAAVLALLAALLFYVLSPALRDMDESIRKGMQDM